MSSSFLPGHQNVNKQITTNTVDIINLEFTTNTVQTNKLSLQRHILTCEDVESNQMNFSVSVLPGLGGGHLHDLAGAVLQHSH